MFWIKYQCWIAILILFFSLTACEKDDRVLFEIPYTVYFDIQPGLNTLETHKVDIFPPLPTNYDAFLNQHGVTSMDIKAIQPTEILIFPRFGTVDYDLIREITVDVFPNLEISERREIGFLFSNTEKLGGEVRVIPGITNVHEILMEEFFSFHIEFKLRRIPDRLIENEMRVVFRVVGE